MLNISSNSNVQPQKHTAPKNSPSDLDPCQSILHTATRENFQMETCQLPALYTHFLN